MTTLNDLRRRLEDEYLEPVNEETPSATIEYDITDTDTLFKITSGILSPDEESFIAPGRLLELDTELVRVVTYDQYTKEVTCKRGVRGTTPAAHTAAESEVRIPTRWPRATIAKTLRASLDGLWQPLFHEATEQSLLDLTSYIPLDPNTVRVLRLEYETRWGDWDEIETKLLPINPLDESTAAAQPKRNNLGSRLCLLTTGVKIVAPDSDDDAIEGLPQKYERIILVDAAAELLAGVDIDAVSQERLTEQMQLEGFPVRSGATISQNLVRFHAYLVDRAHKEIIAKYPRQVERRPVSIWRS